MLVVADGVLAVLVLGADVPPQGLQDAMGLMETLSSLKCTHFLNTVTAFLFLIQVSRQQFYNKPKLYKLLYSGSISICLFCSGAQHRLKMFSEFCDIETKLSKGPEEY